MSRKSMALFTSSADELGPGTAMDAEGDGFSSTLRASQPTMKHTLAKSNRVSGGVFMG
jgi:hypothetical protein